MFHGKDLAGFLGSTSQDRKKGATFYTQVDRYRRRIGFMYCCFYLVGPGIQVGNDHPIYNLLLGVFLVVRWPFKLIFRDHRETVTIHQDHVEVTRTGKFGDAKWTAPVASFRSVLWQRTTKHIHKGKSVGYVIEMTHSDPGKSIVLHAGYDQFEAQRLWSQAAKKLKLPKEKKEVSDTFGDYYIYLWADDIVQGGNGYNGGWEGNGGEEGNGG